MSEQPTETPLSDRVAEEIRVALARTRTSQRALADKLGVNPMWVNDRVNANTEIGLNELERIARALKLPVSDLIPASVCAAPVGAA